MTLSCGGGGGEYPVWFRENERGRPVSREHLMIIDIHVLLLHEHDRRNARRVPMSRSTAYIVKHPAPPSVLPNTNHHHQTPTMNPPRALLTHLPPPAASLAILLATAQLTLFGLRGLWDPDGWAAAYGLPAAPPPASTTTTTPTNERPVRHALVRALAARNVANGALMLGLAWAGRGRALGWVVCANVLVTGADALVVRGLGGEGHGGGGGKEVAHWAGVVHSGVVGGWLLWTG